MPKITTRCPHCEGTGQIEINRTVQVNHLELKTQCGSEMEWVGKTDKGESVKIWTSYRLDLSDGVNPRVDSKIHYFHVTLNGARIHYGERLQQYGTYSYDEIRELCLNYGVVLPLPEQLHFDNGQSLFPNNIEPLTAPTTSPAYVQEMVFTTGGIWIGHSDSRKQVILRSWRENGRPNYFIKVDGKIIDSGHRSVELLSFSYEELREFCLRKHIHLPLSFR